jgi:hypothetical protein
MLNNEPEKIERGEETSLRPPEKIDIPRLLEEFKRILKEQRPLETGTCFFNGIENLYGNEYLRVLVRRNGTPERIFLFFAEKIIPEKGTDYLPGKYGKFYELEYKEKQYIRFYKLQGPHNSFYEDLCDLEGHKVPNKRKILKQRKEKRV